VISVTFPSKEDIVDAAAIAKSSYYSESYTECREKLDYSDAVEFLKKLLLGDRPSDRHESVLEPLVFTFNITGISRVATHQMVRTRHASYMQKSLRRKRDLSADDFVPPDETENLVEYEKAAEMLVKLYHRLIKKGETPDDARRILPIGISTEITMTINARALRNFLTQRLAKAANWEIQKLSKLIVFELIEHELEFLIEDIIKKYNDGKL